MNFWGRRRFFSVRTLASLLLAVHCCTSSAVDEILRGISGGLTALSRISLISSTALQNDDEQGLKLTVSKSRKQH
jgi:hypothetical protein